jgi:hypothetical protein
MSTINNNAVLVNASSQRILALKKYVTPKAEISINGEPYKLAELIGVFQANLDSRASVTAKRAELKAALTEREGTEAARLAVDKGLKAWVGKQFGADSQEAHEFGYPPPKVTEKTVKSKMHAVQLSLATREARHTMGKKEKQRIKGTLVVPTAPADPASTAPPSPSNGIANANGASASLLNGAAH